MSESEVGTHSSIKSHPFSLEAEQSVLGALMLDNHSWDKVAEILTQPMFYRSEHRIIFEHMNRLSNDSQPIDVITLGESLEQSAQLDEAGGMVYLNDLAEQVSSLSNIGAYCDIIFDRSVKRKLIEAGTKITEQAFNPEGRDAGTLIDEAERAVFQIGEERPNEGGPININPLLDGAIKKIDMLFKSNASITGLSTGFTKLNENTSGFQSGDMIIVAARPSMGKTAFALNLVESAIMTKEDECAVVFSLEMPSEQLVARMMSSLGRINAGRIRDGKLEEDEWPRLTTAVNLLKDKKLFLDDTSGLSPSEMRSRLRRLVREHGKISMIMIDYLQLMSIKGFTEGRTAEISEISRSLKAIAKEFECPVIALSQLNRGVEQRPNKRPVNSDLRESGAIEQDADLILFLYRDEYYNPESEDKGIGEVIIGKNRNGEVGSFKLSFLGQYTRFEDLSPDYQGDME